VANIYNKCIQHEGDGTNAAWRTPTGCPEPWIPWRLMRRSLRLGFGNPKLGFRSLVSVEVDATKLAWRLGFGNPKLGFQSLDSVEVDVTKPEAWIRKPKA